MYKNTYHKNGKLESRIGYNEQDLVDGDYEQWYENGQLCVRSHYKNGKREGVEEWWYENGTLRRRAGYKDGKREGTEEWWREDGQLWARTIFRGGEADGLHEQWYPNGQVGEADKPEERQGGRSS